MNITLIDYSIDHGGYRWMVPYYSYNFDYDKNLDYETINPDTSSLNIFRQTLKINEVLNSDFTSDS